MRPVDFPFVVYVEFPIQRFQQFRRQQWDCRVKFPSNLRFVAAPLNARNTTNSGRPVNESLVAKKCGRLFELSAHIQRDEAHSSFSVWFRHDMRRKEWIVKLV